MVSIINEFYVDSGEIFNYVTGNYKFYPILSKRHMFDKSIKTLCLYPIHLLVLKKLAKEKKKINIKEKFVFKTKKYYSIKNIKYYKKIDEYLIFSYNNCKLIEQEHGSDFYIIAGHFSKTHELYKKNFSSNKGFKLKKIEYILNKINMDIYADED